MNACGGPGWSKTREQGTQAQRVFGFGEAYLPGRWGKIWFTRVENKLKSGNALWGCVRGQGGELLGVDLVCKNWWGGEKGLEKKAVEKRTARRDDCGGLENLHRATENGHRNNEGGNTGGKAPPSSIVALKKNQGKKGVGAGE